MHTAQPCVPAGLTVQVMGTHYRRLHPTCTAVHHYCYFSLFCRTGLPALMQPLLGSPSIQPAQCKAALIIRFYRKGAWQQQAEVDEENTCWFRSLLTSPIGVGALEVTARWSRAWRRQSRARGVEPECTGQSKMRHNYHSSISSTWKFSGTQKRCVRSLVAGDVEEEAVGPSWLCPICHLMWKIGSIWRSSVGIQLECGSRELRGQACTVYHAK